MAEKEIKFAPNALEILETWAEDFKIISHPLRMSVLFMLYGSEVLFGKNCLTVSQIRDILSFPKNKKSFNKIEHHLSVLLEKGFVERYADQENEGKSQIKVLYKTSEKTKEFLKAFNLDQKITEALEQ